MKQLSFFLHPVRFFLIILAFSLFGLVLIYDVSVAESLQTFGHPWHFASKHALWIAIGVAAFITTSLIPRELWKKLGPAIFLGAVALLIAVLIPGIGSKIQGAQRWIYFGPIGIQPAEITKLALIIFFATWLEKHQRFGPFIALTGLIFGLIVLQPNLSTAGIVVLIAAIMYFVAGGNMKPLLAFGAIGSVILLMLILAAPYRRQRLQTFLNPSSDPLGRSYHIRQITIALGRGGVWGQGIGLSKQKQQYIPEASSDSIFAIYAEETGFVGSTLLMLAYGWLIWLGFSIAHQQEDRFSALMATGITSWIALHVVLNLAAMAALIPLTGIPLPLIAYGGSHYTAFMAGLGILAGLLREPGKSEPLSRRSGKARMSTRV